MKEQNAEELHQGMIAEAEKSIVGRGDGRISGEDAKRIMSHIGEDEQELGEATRKHIQENYNLTSQAQTAFAEAYVGAAAIAETAEVGGFKIVGGVGQAMGMAFTIYSAIKTANYRDKVLAGITTIEGDLDDIKTEIKDLIKVENSLAAALAYDDFWGTGDTSPIRIINLRWTQAFPGDNNNPKEIIKIKNIQDNYAAVNSAMGSISTKIQNTNISALEMYYNMIDGQSCAVSEIEKCYTYYNRYLIGCLLRGFGLLGHYNRELAKLNSPEYKTTYENWNIDLNVKGTILKNGGNVAQTFIDTIKGNGDSTYVYLQKSAGHSGSKHIHLGDYDLPNKGNQVLVGYEIAVNVQGNAYLAVWQGDFRDDGYVENVTKVNKDDCPIVRMVSDSSCIPLDGGEDGNMGHGLVVFFDKLKIPVPANKVAVDIKLKSLTEAWDNGKGYYGDQAERSGRYIWTAVKVADVVDGKVDMGSAKWLDNDRWEDLHFNSHQYPAGDSGSFYCTYDAVVPDLMIYICGNSSFRFSDNEYKSGALYTPMSTVEFYGDGDILWPWYESKIHQDQFNNQTKSI